MTLFALALMGCTTTRALAPLERGQHGMTVSVGGPFVEFGAPIPLPISTIGYRYGIDGRSDVHAALYPTGAALFGVFGFDVGINRELVAARGAIPRLMIDFNQGFFFGDNAKGEPAGGFRWFPELSAVTTWDLGHAPHRLYLGVDGFFQVWPEAHALITPFLGTELRAARALGIQLEVGWIAPGAFTRYLNPVWYGIEERGAITAKLGFNIYLQQRRFDAAYTMVDE